jgi:hypothetical protein
MQVLRGGPTAPKRQAVIEYELTLWTWLTGDSRN